MHLCVFTFICSDTIKREDASEKGQSLYGMQRLAKVRRASKGRRNTSPALKKSVFEQTICPDNAS